jgi:hypothetical protein
LEKAYHTEKTLYNATMWQDSVITGVQWIFVVALLFTILDKTKKPTLLTSFVSSAGIYIIAFTFATLELWWSFASAAIMATEWGVIAYQRYRLDKKTPSEF